MPALLEGGWNVRVCIYISVAHSLLSQSPRPCLLFSSALPLSFKLYVAAFPLHLWFSTSTLIVFASWESKWEMCRLQICSSSPPRPCLPPALLVCGFRQSCVLCPADYQQLADWPCGTQRYCIVNMQGRFVCACSRVTLVSPWLSSRRWRPTSVCDWVDQTFSNGFHLKRIKWIKWIKCFIDSGCDTHL